MVAGNTTQGPAAKGRLTRTQVAGIAGQLDDFKIAAILETGASVEDLEEAAAWASGESDVMGDMRLRATPAVKALYDILTAEQKFPDERD